MSDPTNNSDYDDFTADDSAISNLTYPLDLDDKKYGGHRVVFFINVQSGGKIVRENQQENVALPPNSLYRKFSGEKVAKLATDKFNIGIKSGQKRLKSSIQLYVPENLIKSYSVDWSQEDMSGIAETVAQTMLKGGEANSTTKGFIDTAVGVGGAMGSNVAESGAAFILNQLSYAQKALNMTPGNSKAQLLFRQVDFNQFMFDYKFSPRDSSEAKQVIEIIRTFRHHMLPEFLSENQYLYVYPSEFEVQYYFKDKQNQFLERHITAVLTNMSIIYNPNGQFTTFPDGMPTHINMQLTFKELGVPTKETSPTREPGA